MHRPVTYKDWRSLWHSTAKDLGWHLFFCWSNSRSFLNRYSYRLLYRLERIQQRLEIENEVKDDSWCDAMLELLAKGDK